MSDKVEKLVVEITGDLPAVSSLACDAAGWIARNYGFTIRPYAEMLTFSVPEGKEDWVTKFVLFPIQGLKTDMTGYIRHVDCAQDHLCGNPSLSIDAYEIGAEKPVYQYKLRGSALTISQHD